MMLEFNPILVPLACCALVLCWLSWKISRESCSAGAGSYALLMLAIAGWIVSNMGEKIFVATEGKLFFANIQYFLGSIMPICWYVFACRYSGKDQWAGAGVIYSLSVWPIAVAGLTPIDGETGWFRASVEPTVSQLGWLGTQNTLLINYGPLFYVHVGLAYLLLGAGLVILGMFLIQSAPSYSWRLFLLWSTPIPALVASIVYIYGFRPIGNIDLTTFAFTLSTGLGAWVLLGERVLDLVPIARNTIFRFLPDPVFVVDLMNRVVDANRSAESLVRKSPIPPGRDILELLPMLASYLTTDGSPATDDLRPKYVELKWQEQSRRFAVKLTPMTESDRPVGRVIELVDQTDQLMFEEQRADWLLAVHRSQKLESLGFLAGTVAHEFNNLMSGILGNASLARDESPEGSMVRRWTERVVESTEKAAELTHQLQSYAGRDHVELAPILVGPILSKTVEILRWSVGPSIKLETQIDPNPLCIKGDPTQIRQVIANLTINAAESIEAGKGRVTVQVHEEQLRPEEIRMATYSAGIEPGPVVAIDVYDDGAGMTPETMDHLMEPFFSTKHPSRGLGLAAVLGVVRSHRGAIFFNSAIGRGTHARVVFRRLAVGSLSRTDGRDLGLGESADTQPIATEPRGH